MDPNSQHQLWSRWDVTITPPRGRLDARTLEELRAAWGRFVRQAFGTTAGQVRLEKKRAGLFSLRARHIFAQVRLEGVPAHDAGYRDRQKARIVQFFGSGFGPGTRVHIDVRIEAGDVQDGSLPSQLVMLPTLVSPGANHALVALDNVAGPEALLHGQSALP
jgi:hypothetical protein